MLLVFSHPAYPFIIYCFILLLLALATRCDPGVVLTGGSLFHLIWLLLISGYGIFTAMSWPILAASFAIAFLGYLLLWGVAFALERWGNRGAGEGTMIILMPAIWGIPVIGVSIAVKAVWSVVGS